ncbi:MULTISPECIES: hypothetical protein [unclassified Archaeoglobus]|uniref:hypothetical protein n=1 Tax=unclassified Archaeoglobus TaxID=2643606 RepID=UPI0025C19F87|nr:MULTISPECIES: hypothetical protein [unclassified Archaeoglobus]
MKVCSDVPEMWEGLIRKAMRIEGWDTISAYIRELIKKDLVAKGLLGAKSVLIDSDGDCEILSDAEVI